MSSCRIVYLDIVSLPFAYSEEDIQGYKSLEWYKKLNLIISYKKQFGSYQYHLNDDVG